MRARLMRARRGRWGLVGGGWVRALLALGLLLQAASFGREVSRAAPAFDPAVFDPSGAICAAHTDGAGIPDGGGAPAGPHHPCCILLCGTAPPPALPPVAAPPPPVRLGARLGRPASRRGRASRRWVRHGARAPPIA